MAFTSESKQIVRYLLDEMDEEERCQIEDRLIRDPSFFQIIAATEDDLIMRYERKDLGRDLLLRFIEVYMNSPARRARVESARVLRDEVRAVKASRQPGRLKPAWFRLLMAGAAVVTAVVLFLFWVSLGRPPLGQQEQPRTVFFSLKPGLTRSSGGAQVFISNGAEQVHFELEKATPPDGESYRAVLSRPEQEGVWSGTVSWTTNRAIVTVPVAMVQPGDYTLELQFKHNGNWEGEKTYYFRATR